ncbi:MAG: putative feruloyl esterase precursor [Novosphingobium sp.]|nr:putative feruloyl esterase precursor [Novosphingobium sp.]
MHKVAVAALAGVSLLIQSGAAWGEGAEGKPRDPSEGNLTWPTENCDIASVQKMAPANTTIAFAYREGQQACRVDGWVTTQNPGPNRVLFGLTLPNNFNGRYLFQGVGGAAGQLPIPSRTLLARGYALAGTDAGTGAKTIADFGFKSDPAKHMDFLWRGVQSSAVATQQITRNYYQRAKIGRYISGCSGGGQMGMSNAIRFGGENFDGFITAATVWPGAAFKPHVYQIMAHMQNHPEGWLSPELLKKAYDAIIARYDDTDGARDGIIHDARNIQNFDLNILRGVGFTPAQIETFQMITTPREYTGPGIYAGGMQAGWPASDVLGWVRYLTGTRAPPWPTTAQYSTSALQAMGVPFYHVMADTNIRSQKPGLDYWKITDEKQLIDIATFGGTEVSTATLDMSKVAQSGAKMIIWHGTADEANSYLDNLKGYQAVVAKNPNHDDWLRLFFVPGVQHCAGGNGPTDIDDPMVEALATWVETGKAPEAILAPRSTPQKGIDRVFRLCPEPKRAALKSPGLDVNSPDNWECRAPQT